MALAIPTLSYVGSVDTSSSNTGNVILQVTFPSNIKALMFEYKYQPESTQIAVPDDLQYSGFVYPDAAEPGCDGTVARGDGEMHLLHSAD